MGGFINQKSTLIGHNWPKNVRPFLAIFGRQQLQALPWAFIAQSPCFFWPEIEALTLWLTNTEVDTFLPRWWVGVYANVIKCWNIYIYIYHHFYSPPVLCASKVPDFPPSYLSSWRSSFGQTLAVVGPSSPPSIPTHPWESMGSTAVHGNDRMLSQGDAS